MPGTQNGSLLGAVFLDGTLYYLIVQMVVESAMQNVERLSITLPVEMARMIRAKVEEGGYASNSEVIREAMRAWAAQEEIRAGRHAGIRAKIAEADADPRPSLTEDEVDQHFRARRQSAGTMREKSS